MRERLAERLRAAYERLLLREIDGVPAHVAIIMDGNRRYARRHGAAATDGHREGAETTEQVLEWCEELGVEELTLYAFSTENFNRPADEREALFDLLTEKFEEFADDETVQDRDVRIRAIGDIERLPARARRAVRYAEEHTEDNETFTLNVALAYGGRSELLEAARDVARAVADGDLSPSEVGVDAIERRLYGCPMRDVDLVVRTGGDERTSNFLPWHGNGSEAAVFFCAPYWPEFTKTDFLRAVRTYEHREQSWRRTRARRALTLLTALGNVELSEARRVLSRFREHLPRGEAVAEFEERVESAGDGESASRS